MTKRKFHGDGIPSAQMDGFGDQDEDPELRSNDLDSIVEVEDDAVIRLQSDLTQALISWSETSISGIEMEGKVFGLIKPRDPAVLKDYFTTSVFPRYASLVKVGKKKYSRDLVYTNSATDKASIVADTLSMKTYFLDFLDWFIQKCNNMTEKIDIPFRYSSGPGNNNMVKGESGLDFKLQYRSADRIMDMLRTVIICPSISKMTEAILEFRKVLDKSINVKDAVASLPENSDRPLIDRFESILTEAKYEAMSEAELDMFKYRPSPNILLIRDYSITNFYDNIARFSDLDRSEGNYSGYGGIHFHLIFELYPVVGAVPIRLNVEVQFQLENYFDGSLTSVKELTHDAYRAIHTREADKLGVRAECLAAIEMYNVFAQDLALD